jgi:hypothetical protein
MFSGHVLWPCSPPAISWMPPPPPGLTNSRRDLDPPKGAPYRPWLVSKTASSSVRTFNLWAMGMSPAISSMWTGSRGEGICGNCLHQRRSHALLAIYLFDLIMSGPSRHPRTQSLVRSESHQRVRRPHRNGARHSSAHGGDGRRIYTRSEVLHDSIVHELQAHYIDHQPHYNGIHNRGDSCKQS